MRVELGELGVKMGELAMPVAGGRRGCRRGGSGEAVFPVGTRKLGRWWHGSDDGKERIKQRCETLQ